MRNCIIISTDQRLIAPTILMVGSEPVIWQNAADSQGLSHNVRSCKHIDLYCVENEQENGVISDLEKVIGHRM
jgi:hypothetical protein